MLDKPISQITEADLQELVDEKHREGKLIDFKAELWRIDKTTNPNQIDRDKQIIEFLKDVSSFANTDGGHLIAGIKEDDGAASELCGIESTKQDDWKNRLDQLMQNWIEPRISAEMRFLGLSNGKDAIVLEVAPSLIGPHRITYQDHGHFYARNSHGAFRMDTAELRTTFNRSLAIAEQIRAFRHNRLRLIDGAEPPLPLTSEPLVVLHLIPQSAFTTSSDFSIARLKQEGSAVHPLGLDHTPFSRPNLDGYLLRAESLEQKDSKCRRYVQLFRSGIIEAVSANCSFVPPTSTTRYWSPQAEKLILDALPDYLSYLSKLGVRPPIWLFVTLCKAKSIKFPHDFGNRHFDRDLILLSEQLINDPTVAPHVSLRPIFDQIWNAAGFDKCFRINEAGEMVRLEMDRFV